MIASEPDITDYYYNELLWNILFSKQKFGLCGVSRNLGSLVLLQNVALTFLIYEKFS